MSEPYRGSKLQRCHSRAAFAASLALQVSARARWWREEPLLAVLVRKRVCLHRSPATTKKDTYRAARTGTAVGRTSLSFSDPHPQAPPALWGAGTTGEPWDHTRGMTIRSG